MSWRGEKADYLQKNRDFSFLNDDDRSQKEAQRSRAAKGSGERVAENQEKLLRLKALEKQRAARQKKQHAGSLSPDAREMRRETERNGGASGSKRGSSGHDTFGSFFGKVEKVVAKRVVDEERAREIAARERRLAEAEKFAKRKAESRNGSDAKHLARAGSSAGSRPLAKPKPQNAATVKAQKLKDNRDYSFLFSDEPPSKAGGAAAKESRPQASKASREVRAAAEGPGKQKAAGSQVQKPRPASNGAVRPGSGQGSSGAEGRRGAASRPVSAGERDNNARDRRHESERRSEKEGRHASGGRAERDVRQEGERRVEQGRGVGSSRAGLAGKGAGVERPGSTLARSGVRGPDREKRANQERPTPSAGRPKATNHDRPGSTSKSTSLTRISQSSGQRISQAGNGSSRDRVLERSTTETRVSQSGGQRAPQNDGSAMKRKMFGEPGRKPVIAAKSNDGRRVDRSRYEDSDSESEVRRLVAGGSRGAQSGGSRMSKPSAVANRRPIEEPMRRKAMDAPMRRRAAEEPARRRPGDEVMRRRPSEEVMRSKPLVAKERKRQRRADSDEESEYESESEGVRPRNSGVSSIIQKLFRYNPNKYADLDDEDDRNMETSFKHIQAEERRSARLAREEDEREQELIEEEERAERERKLRRQKMMK